MIDNALTQMNLQRATYGATMNRLEYAIDNLSDMLTNTQSSRSRIEDADYAKESAELARTQIIQQAATAMLAQANQGQQGLLQLIS